MKYLVFEITGKCNLKCLYCYNSRYNTNSEIGKELSKKRILEIIDEAKELGFELIAFSGGEPFLRKDLLDILKKCPIPVSILTNGEVISDKDIEKLSCLKNIKELRFSLDGFIGHDLVRINSSHDRVIKKIQKALSLKLYTSVNTMITKYNVDELMLLYDLISTNFDGIMWRLDIPIYTGRCKQNEGIYVEKDHLFQKIRDLIKRYIKEKPKFKIIIANVFKSNLIDKGFYKHSLTEHPCEYALGSATIRPNGELSFCPSLSLTFGNLHKDSLKDVFENKDFKKFRKMHISDISECKKCKYLYICGTGCRADAYELSGDINLKDNSACANMFYLEKYILPLLSKERREEYDRLLIKAQKQHKKVMV